MLFDHGQHVNIALYSVQYFRNNHMLHWNCIVMQHWHEFKETLHRMDINNDAENVCKLSMDSYLAST